MDYSFILAVVRVNRDEGAGASRVEGAGEVVIIRSNREGRQPFVERTLTHTHRLSD